MKRSKGVVILNEDACRLVYTPDVMRDLSHYVDFLAPPMTAAAVDGNLQVLSDVDVVFSGWGGPRLDQQFLDAVPKLNALFYGAGTLADLITDAVWRRMPPLTITTAISTNAVPVTEYTLATILFSLKHGWRFAREARSGGAVRSPDHCHTAPGCYGTTVGLISLGTIATQYAEASGVFRFQRARV